LNTCKYFANIRQVHCTPIIHYWVLGTLYIDPMLMFYILPVHVKVIQKKMTDDAINSMPPHADAEQNTRYFILLHIKYYMIVT